VESLRLGAVYLEGGGDKAICRGRKWGEREGYAHDDSAQFLHLVSLMRKIGEIKM
jgi:1,4-dihydroxy-2-naphthoyl-CoA synthase